MRALWVIPFLCVTACVPSLPSRGPVDLRSVETHVTRFGFAVPRGGLCPGQPVDLDMELVTSDGEKLYPKRHEIEDAIFDLSQVRLSSAQGTFDRDGRFFPNPDPRVSAQTGFMFYVSVPHGPTFTARYPPIYECDQSLGRAGEVGLQGERGSDALYTDWSHPTARDPSGGTSGFSGGDGGIGGDGPSFTVYVTWVRTPDYTRLLAARAEGDVEGFFLRAPGSPLSIIARGGSGGNGGIGGRGSNSLTQRTVSSSGSKRSRSAWGSQTAPVFVQAGPGGNGGAGGQGGHGGQVHVVLDDRFNDLAGWITTDATGGAGGQGGRGGYGGDNRPDGPNIHETSALKGTPGAHGADGPRGPDGAATIERGAVLAHFENLGAIVPL